MALFSNILESSVDQGHFQTFDWNHSASMRIAPHNYTTIGIYVQLKAPTTDGNITIL